MEYTWLIPDPYFLKLNVHYIQAAEPNHRGNPNGVGAILRDTMGTKIWGALGPMADIDELQAILWAAHAGMQESFVLGILDSMQFIWKQSVMSSVMPSDFKRWHSLLPVTLLKIKLYVGSLLYPTT